MRLLLAYVLYSPPGLIVVGLTIAMFAAVPFSEMRPVLPAWEPPALQRFPGRLVRAEKRIASKTWKNLRT
jgi:hypothetical protein